MFHFRCNQLTTVPFHCHHRFFLALSRLLAHLLRKVKQIFECIGAGASFADNPLISFNNTD